MKSYYFNLFISGVAIFGILNNNSLLQNVLVIYTWIYLLLTIFCLGVFLNPVKNLTPKSAFVVEFYKGLNNWKILITHLLVISLSCYCLVVGHGILAITLVIIHLVCSYALDQRLKEIKEE